VTIRRTNRRVFNNKLIKGPREVLPDTICPKCNQRGNHFIEPWRIQVRDGIWTCQIKLNY
jgi:hypothetical protein